MTTSTTAAKPASSGVEPSKKHDLERDPSRHQLGREGRLDKDLEETFPASDPPATSGVTKIGKNGQEKGAPKGKSGGKS